MRPGQGGGIHGRWPVEKEAGVKGEHPTMNIEHPTPRGLNLANYGKAQGTHGAVVRRASHQGTTTRRAKRKPQKRFVLGVCDTSGIRLNRAPSSTPEANPAKWAITSVPGVNARSTKSIPPLPGFRMSLAAVAGAGLVDSVDAEIGAFVEECVKVAMAGRRPEPAGLGEGGGRG